MAESAKGVGKVNITRPSQVGERGDMVRVEVRDEDVGNIRRSKVKVRELIHDQIFFIQMDRSHPAVKTFREFFRLIEEAIGIASVEKHRTEFRVTKQCEHGWEVNAAPTSTVDGDMFGSSAIACVKDVNFHNS